MASKISFLSSNAQDFIEEPRFWPTRCWDDIFLSSNAQDFIEDSTRWTISLVSCRFLSSNAQDFIEESYNARHMPTFAQIPEQ